MTLILKGFPETPAAEFTSIDLKASPKKRRGSNEKTLKFLSMFPVRHLKRPYKIYRGRRPAEKFAEMRRDGIAESQVDATRVAGRTAYLKIPVWPLPARPPTRA